MGHACLARGALPPEQQTRRIQDSLEARGVRAGFPGCRDAVALPAPRHNVRFRPMRNSIWRCMLVLVSALSVAVFSSGCRSGGWGMPGSSLVSWGKKKPPTSSIAGTHEVPKPPSVSVPPYPSGGTSPTSSVASTASGATAPRSTSTPYGAGAMGSGGYGIQQTAGAEGYATGPYNTGRATAATASTQQGFYSPTYSANGGPVASTADARGSAYPAPGAPYGTSPSASNSSSPAAYGGLNSPANSAYGTSPSAAYGASAVPSSSYGPAAPSSGYPTTSPASDYSSTTPNSGYGTTPGAAAYPSTSAGSTSAPSSAPTLIRIPTTRRRLIPPHPGQAMAQTPTAMQRRTAIHRRPAMRLPAAAIPLPQPMAR